jgi:hypothetical protein
MHETDPDEPIRGAEADEAMGTRERASDQGAAPAPDVMGEPGAVTPDVMGTRQPRSDKALGDRAAGDATPGESALDDPEERARREGELP